MSLGSRVFFATAQLPYCSASCWLMNWRCGARRTAVAAQGEALCEQMQLVAVELESALVGQLLDDVQVLVLVRHREGDFESEAVGQGGNGFERVAHADVVALTVGHALADEVAAVGGRVDDEVRRFACQTTLDERLERGEVAVLAAEGQVIEEEDEAERRAQRLAGTAAGKQGMWRGSI